MTHSNRQTTAPAEGIENAPSPEALAKSLFGGAKPRPETKSKRDARRKREAGKG